MSKGDLAQLSAELGISADELMALIKRIDASAVEPDSEAWIEVIAPNASARARAALKRVRGSIETEASDWNPERLAGLRSELADAGLGGFIVPQADEHMGEYLPASERRLEWLTGFTGSMGTAIVHGDEAALFVDGRYLLQASLEVDQALFQVRHFAKPRAVEWLAGRVRKGERIGFDPRLYSVKETDATRAALEERGAELAAVEINPIDRLWTDRPPQPLSPTVAHRIEYAGEASQAKRDRLAKELAENNIVAAVFNQNEAAAWLLNVRGRDLANTPISKGYVVLGQDGHADYYVERRRLGPDMAQHLGNQTTIREFDELPAGLAQLGKDGQRVAIDPSTATAWIRDRLKEGGAEIVFVADATLRARALKNPVELAGMRAAHARDGIAVTRFLKWVVEAASSRGLSELDAIARLERFRADLSLYRGPSFDTIAGAGPNGAIVHYRATEKSNRAIDRDCLFLVDSGAQYLDGTTDITRTIAIGAVEEAARRHFTLVLKGHIAIATARFPKDTSGSQIDALARQHLWRHGLDYDHGTGHGVGSYLGVHEGPQRIARSGTVPLEAGMVVSNEPGYYLEGRYGIRIENLLVVREAAVGDGFLEFETLTLAPIERRLIDAELLTADEETWLDAYHRRVCESIGPHLGAEDKAWLAAVTKPIRG